MINEKENPAVEEEKAPVAEKPAEPLPEEEKPVAEEAPAEEGGEEAVAEGKKKHAISNNLLRWILFGCTLIFLGLGVLIQVLHPSYTAFGTTINAENFISYIQSLSGMSDGTQIFTSILTILMAVGWIIGLVMALIRVIMLFVCAVGFLAGGKNRKKSLRRFRSAVKNLAHLAGYYLIFDLLLVMTGTALGTSFIVEIIILALLMVCGWLNRELYEEIAGEGFNWKRFFPEMAFMCVYFLIGVLVVMQFKDRATLAQIPGYVGRISASSGSAETGNLVIWMILNIFGGAFGIVAMVNGATMISSFAAYYPYNDQKKDDEGNPKPRVQGALLPKSIVMFIFTVVAGACFLAGGYFDGAMALVNYAILPLCILLMVIVARVAYSIDHAAPKDKEEEEAEED